MSPARTIVSLLLAAAAAAGQTVDDSLQGADAMLSADTAAGTRRAPAAAQAPEVRGKRLDTCAVTGLVLNKPGVVRSASGLKQGSIFTALDVQEAVRAIYRLGLFSTVEVYILDETDSSASLEIRVQEYPVCDGVTFAGAKKLKVKDLEEVVNIHAGRVVSDQALDENVRALRHKYADEGYLNAEIEAQLEEGKAPGNAALKFAIKEGPRVRIKRITLAGNTAFKTGRLKRKFKTKEDRWWRSGKYDETAYRENIDSLLIYYQNHGYLDARVARDSVWYAENKRDIYIEMQLEEGPRYYAGDFFFEGNTVVPTDSLKGKVTLKAGKPFEKDKFDMTRYYVEDAYREEGYLWVQVKDERAYRGDTIDVTMQIAEGRPAIVRKISIKGNSKTRDKVIRRNIVITPSQKYRQSLMARSMREIMQLNYFDNVNPDMKPNDDGTIDLEFEVTEKDNVGQLQIGAAYSERDRFVGTFATTIPNFRGNGQELTLNVEYGKYRQDYSVGFREPWAFDRPISLQTSVYYNVTKYASLHSFTESYGLRLGMGRKLKWPDDYWRVDGLYQISHDQESRNTSYHGPDSTIKVPQEGIMSRLTLTLYRNDTDVPQFPSRGSVFYLTPEIAGLGGSYQYFKTTVGYDRYFPLFWKFVLGLRTKFGTVNRLPWSDTLVISRWDLYNAGGVYSDGTIRGYPEYTFGGRDDPVRGQTMMVMTTMIQFPVLERQLYLSVFGDLGNTWASVAQVDPTDTYKGVGFGMRLVIPMLGMLGFDFAWRLDDPRRTAFVNDPDDRFEFHFLLNRGF